MNKKTLKTSYYFFMAGLALSGLVSVLTPPLAGDRHRHAEFLRIAASQRRYVCPMHSDITSDGPGKCPKCGMDLEPEKE